MGVSGPLASRDGEVSTPATSPWAIHDRLVQLRRSKASDACAQSVHLGNQESSGRGNRAGYAPMAISGRVGRCEIFFARSRHTRQNVRIVAGYQPVGWRTDTVEPRIFTSNPSESN